MSLLNDIFLITFQNDDEMKPDRERNDDYYPGKKGRNYSEYSSMTKYQPSHGNKSAIDNKATRYERGNVGGGYQPVRQGSETRSNLDSEMNRNHRDNRSQDPSSSHFKPPIGQAVPQQRLSYNFAALQRLPLNIDQLPPRLKKKHILENGLPEELVEKNITELLQFYPNNTMSMGRNNRNNRFDHQQNFSSGYHNKYGNQQQNFDGNHNQRAITPPQSKVVTSRQTATPPNKHPTQSSSSSRYDTVQRRDETTSLSITKSVQDDGSGSFDWSEDVMNSQSLPYEVNANHPSKYDDSNRPRNRRRNRR